MNAGDWLSGQAAGSPPRLLARLTETLRAVPELREAQGASESLIGAAVTLLHELLESEAALERDGALALLAADASVTWAMEAAAGHPASLTASAERAMHRIMQVAS